MLRRASKRQARDGLSSTPLILTSRRMECISRHDFIHWLSRSMTRFKHAVYTASWSEFVAIPFTLLTLDHVENFASVPGPVVSFELPSKITFAGDSVPLKLQDVKERLDKELHINTYLHGSTIFLMKRANR